jgi:hypothetical protein
MPPLTAVRARSVLQHDRDSLSGLLVVHAVLDAVDLHVHVPADGRIEVSGDLLDGGMSRCGSRLAHEADEPQNRRLVRGHVTDEVALDGQTLFEL